MRRRGGKPAGDVIASGETLLSKGSSHPNENLRFSIRDCVCPGKRLAGIRSLRNHFSDRQVQGGGVRVILKKEAGCPKGEGALSQDVLAQSR